MFHFLFLGYNTRSKTRHSSFITLTCPMRVTLSQIYVLKQDFFMLVHYVSAKEYITCVHV